MSTTTIMSRAAAVVGALLLGVSVASCSDSGDGADTSTTSSTTSTSTSARATTGTTAGAGTGGDGIAVGEPTPGGGGGNGGGGGGGGDPVDDRCSLEALSQAYGDGPGDIVGVAHCDGDWAVSQGSDDSLNRVFMHRDHGWVGFAADSVNPTTGTACYSTDRLQQIGAPAGVWALLPLVRPGAAARALFHRRPAPHRGHRRPRHPHLVRRVVDARRAVADGQCPQLLSRRLPVAGLPRGRYLGGHRLPLLHTGTARP